MTLKHRNGTSAIFDIAIDLDDDDAIDAAAELLDTTSDTVRKVISFAHQVLRNADDQTLTQAELVTAMVSVLRHLVKVCGPPAEQAKLCMSLCNALWAACAPHQDQADDSSHPFSVVSYDHTTVH